LDKVRIGFIGCGGISNGHIQRLTPIEEAEVTALADTNPANAEKLKQGFPKLAGARIFSDYREMLDKAELDAVGIFSPHTVHFQQAMDSLGKGLHVLMEKPMVCKVEHAKKLIAEAEKKKKVVLLSYQRHYMPAFRYMREVIQKGDLGEVRFLSALQTQQWYKGCKGSWRQTQELSGGGQLNDSGSHLIDIIFWMTGLQAAEIFGFIDNLDTPVDINSAITVKYRNGAEGTYSVVAESPTWWEDITIWGTKGMFFYRNGVLWHQKGEANKAPEQPVLPAQVSDPDRNFINVILKNEQNESPAAGGLRVIELTEAAWESGRTGKPVKVK